MNCFFNPIKTSVSKDGGGGGGEKSVLPFSKLMIGKKKRFFNALVRVFAEKHANTWQGSPVLVGLI